MSILNGDTVIDVHWVYLKRVILVNETKNYIDYMEIIIFNMYACKNTFINELDWRLHIDYLPFFNLQWKIAGNSWKWAKLVFYHLYV